MWEIREKYSEIQEMWSRAKMVGKHWFDSEQFVESKKATSKFYLSAVLENRCTLWSLFVEYDWTEYLGCSLTFMFSLLFKKKTKKKQKKKQLWRVRFETGWVNSPDWTLNRVNGGREIIYIQLFRANISPHPPVKIAPVAETQLKEKMPGTNWGWGEKPNGVFLCRLQRLRFTARAGSKWNQ